VVVVTADAHHRQGEARSAAVALAAGLAGGEGVDPVAADGVAVAIELGTGPEAVRDHRILDLDAVLRAVSARGVRDEEDVVNDAVVVPVNLDEAGGCAGGTEVEGVV